MIDIHNHVLIGIDDGPKTEEEAVALLKQAIDNGITDIIATPHHHSGAFLNPRSKIIEKMEELSKLIETHQLDIKVHPGQEIRINGDMVTELQFDVSIPLNQSQYVLVEFSFTEVPNYVEKLLYDLQMKGYIPVIAHPERCKPITKNPNRLYEIIEKGAIAQVTASSISGALGQNLKETSLAMIENNLAHVISSDAHSTKTRPFLLKEAYEVVTEELGENFTEVLQLNAGAILHNKEVKVKPPQKLLPHSQIKKQKKKKFLGLF
ncbi:tyrosine-protein phosphatase [Salinicoccus sesuvii]|uniref:Tyrosine-protein phosphatase n=1 Tax=Salinicoccus sesuvii TaxID=868281 RepID=A0ABV7N899_9STAP